MNDSAKKNNSWVFCLYNACPDKSTITGGMAQSVLNVISVINQCSWQTSYKNLLEEAHTLGLMPDDIHCVKALLAKQGFFQQPRVKNQVSIEEFCRVMNHRCHDGQIAVIQVATRSIGPTLYVVVPGENVKNIGKSNRVEQYLCVGPEYPAVNLIQEVWIKWKDGEDHSPIKRRKGRSTSSPVAREIPDTGSFHYHLGNPAGKNIGDCSVRALSSACGISWYEAMNRLVKSTDYLTTRINIDSYISKTLEREGFVKHHPICDGGKLLTGKEFCSKMSSRYRHGEKIVAYIGRSHIAAVLPFREEDTIRYKIVDSWDSTSKKIGTYFVKETNGEFIPKTEPSEVKAGTKVMHPVFGEGEVKRISHHGWLVVSFGEKQKLLDTKWALVNCRRITS